MIIIYLPLILLIAYFVWDRYIRVKLRINYYEKQGIQFPGGFVPFFGSYPKLIKFIEEHKPKQYPIIDFINHTQGSNPPTYTGMLIARQLCLIINRHEPLQDLFITKNKYFDKHPNTGQLVGKTLGDSTLFQKSNELWAKKRKSISSSLYKQKLVQMVETMKDIACETMAEWEKQGELDIVAETANMMMKNILACVFGRQNENPQVQYKENGEIKQVKLGQSIQSNIGKGIEREFQLHLTLFPELYHFYFTKQDKELVFNVDQGKDYIKALIKSKREQFARTGKYEGDDLLTILLQDELFQNDDSMLIDECLTFFAAGAQTTAVSITNFLCYMAQNQQQEEKLRNELKSILKFFGKENKDLINELNMEIIEDFNYLKYCFYESLRIEPPIVVSSSCQVNEDMEMSGVTIKKDEMLLINIHQIHHNSDQWVENEQYIPERFDPSSKYYLTPAGTPRHPTSFIPFIGGKRVCLGKTFAEYAFKTIVPIMMSGRRFRFTNDEHLTSKPHYDALMFKKPEIRMRLEKISKSY
ncbi:cytochrome p450 [Stylonychia lemnae]|uniref:Cytochrome p450 n=1 Tax=Stylonychia lemnae TaxID=5949 RepID=A0A078AWU5_STYLE|nr:cytochrome p450 [Stylonychia lemnae]|eukprot:CDW86900.1 cytochrome p450 [Stylonychia lemnae]